MIAALRNLRVYTFGGGAFIVGNESVQKRVGDIRPLLQVSLSTKESWPRAREMERGKNTHMGHPNQDVTSGVFSTDLVLISTDDGILFAFNT